MLLGWKRPPSRRKRENKEVDERMSVASVTEISAVSADGLEAAIREGLDRANKTLRNIQSAWVKDMNVMIEDGNIVGYKVNLVITFVLESSVEDDTVPADVGAVS
jgi:flavin-binding protein dodecin